MMLVWQWGTYLQRGSAPPPPREVYLRLIKILAVD